MKKIYAILWIPVLFAVCMSFLISCKTEKKEIQEISSRELTLDEAHMLILKKTLNYRSIASLDHHRMAMTTGAYTPAAIASIFIKDNMEMYKPLLINQQLAMDFPFKILAFSDQDSENAKIAYTSADFLMKRHGLSASDLAFYDQEMKAVIAALPSNLIVSTDLSTETKDFGVIKMESKYSFDETVSRIRALIKMNQDARWFTEIDFQKEARNYKLDVAPTFLCLFGAPKPGALAMHDAPEIGLDAFCQKVLVYENKGKTYVCFSDMVAFSKLYYGRSNKGQEIVTKRMTAALKKAIGI